MPLSFQCTFANVPFVEDQSRKVRMEQPAGAGEESSQLPPAKQQPLPDLMDELNRLIDQAYLNDYSLPGDFHGRAVSALARQNPIGPEPAPSIKINDWYYPVTASRWSVFRGLATSSQVKAMIAACNQGVGRSILRSTDGTLSLQTTLNANTGGQSVLVATGGETGASVLVAGGTATVTENGTGQVQLVTDGSLAVTQETGGSASITSNGNSALLVQASSSPQGTFQITQTGSPPAPTALWSPQPFVMQAAPLGPSNNPSDDADFIVATNMYLLPPRPLAEHGGQLDGLYLVTLVDERYYWQWSTVSLTVHQDTTWDSLITQLAMALNCVINYDPIPSEYGQPEKDSQLRVTQEGAAVLLDAVAFNIGCTVTRAMDGSYFLQRPSQAQDIAEFNRQGIPFETFQTLASSDNAVLISNDGEQVVVEINAAVAAAAAPSGMGVLVTINLFGTTAVGATATIVETAVPSNQLPPSNYLINVISEDDALLDVEIIDGGNQATISKDTEGLLEIAGAGTVFSVTLFPTFPAFQVVRTAGGDMFYPGNAKLPVGDLTQAKNAVCPNSISVSFPYYVQGNDPVPHFYNSRYKNQRPTSWFEDSYGANFTVNVPISSGTTNTVGLQGISGYSPNVTSTAKALIAKESDVVNNVNPLNASGLTSLAMRLAGDFWDRQIGAALDETYPGTVNWIPEAFHDIIWTYSPRIGQARTRVMRTQWNQQINTMQQAAVPLSGSTNIPPGMGGQSVAQTHRDTFSGYPSFAATSGGPSVVPFFTSFDGTTLASGSLQILTTSVAYLPSDQRWKGQIDNEVMLLEGTSGGLQFNPSNSIQLLSGTLGSGVNPVQVSGSYVTNIVYRGLDGTVQQGHSGTNQSSQNPTVPPLYQVVPDVSYGINLLDWGPGQFVFPAETTSGGIQGMRVVPQVQTVQVVAGPTSLGPGGAIYWSGTIQSFDPTQGTFQQSSQVWIVERQGQQLTAGQILEGQLLSYSPGSSGGSSLASGSPTSGSPTSGAITSGNPPSVVGPVYGVSLTGGGGQGATIVKIVSSVATNSVYPAVIESFSNNNLNISASDGAACWFYPINNEPVISGQRFLASQIGVDSGNTGQSQAQFTGTATGQGWTNPSNAQGPPDQNFAKATFSNGPSPVLMLTNFGFSIPTGATIDGITVAITSFENDANTSIMWNLVQLLQGGNPVGNNLSNGQLVPQVSASATTFGGSSNLWGTTWTPAIINNSNFGVQIAVTSMPQAEFDVDAVQITVNYH